MHRCKGAARKRTAGGAARVSRQSLYGQASGMQKRTGAPTATDEGRGPLAGVLQGVHARRMHVVPRRMHAVCPTLQRFPFIATPTWPSFENSSSNLRSSTAETCHGRAEVRAIVCNGRSRLLLTRCDARCAVRALCACAVCVRACAVCTRRVDVRVCARCVRARRITGDGYLLDGTLSATNDAGESGSSVWLTGLCVACVCVRARACLRARVCACVRARMCPHACVRAVRVRACPRATACLCGSPGCVRESARAHAHTRPQRTVRCRGCTCTESTTKLRPPPSR